MKAKLDENLPLRIAKVWTQGKHVNSARECLNRGGGTGGAPVAPFFFYAGGETGASARPHKFVTNTHL
jgi:hypothetical protein